MKLCLRPSAHTPASIRYYRKVHAHVVFAISYMQGSCVHMQSLHMPHARPLPCSPLELALFLTGGINSIFLISRGNITFQNVQVPGQPKIAGCLWMVSLPPSGLFLQRESMHVHYGISIELVVPVPEPRGCF